MSCALIYITSSSRWKLSSIPIAVHSHLPHKSAHVMAIGFDAEAVVLVARACQSHLSLDEKLLRQDRLVNKKRRTVHQKQKQPEQC
jgi:hypothetical protein